MTQFAWRSLSRRNRATVLVLVLLGLSAFFFWRENPRRGLPYHDSFAAGKTEEWTSFAGNWNLVDNAIENNSDERGAKFITGSPHWKSYEIQADIQLLGTGDAGLLIRASNVERGVDSYDGYYAGLRTNDQTLILGRARHGWQEFPPTPMPGGVLPGRWYRLRVAAHDCILSASAAAIGTSDIASVSIDDPGCPKSGRAGLRSVGAGGMWRNIKIIPWTRDNSGNASPALPPKHVALFPTSQGTVPMMISQPAPHREHGELPVKTIQAIRNLRLFSVSKPAHAIVRGAVILTHPVLYVQDSSGGVRVETTQPAPLKIGDEVEVEGDVYPHGLSATILHATEQPLGGLAPIPPLSITADQAATGTYDSMFVEVEGRLEKKIDSENHITLEFRDGLQTFRATAGSSATSAVLNRLQKESTVRLRGVCMVGSEYTGNTVPFVLIVNSPEDVKVLLGPPWWSVEHLVLLAIAMLGAGFLVHLFYSRAEEWRLHAVIDERERLAHEIHDTLAQSFAGIGFQLRAIRNRLSRNPSTVNVQVLLDELNLASELVRHSHDEARRSIATLRPDAVEAIGLVYALEQSARRMVARGAIVVEATHTGEARMLPLRVLDSLFRIGQEAFANAIQHGHPQRIGICLHYDQTSVTLVIEDDGSGFVFQPESSGFGIAGMRRRAEAIDAVLDLESTPGKGTRISVRAPTPRTSWLRRLAYTGRK